VFIEKSKSRISKATPFVWLLFSLALALIISACGSSQKTVATKVIDSIPIIVPIPHVASELALNIAYPPAGMMRPSVDSNFVFGTLGTSGSLTINGNPVRVAANGAFLAFLPMPRDGKYKFVAHSADAVDSTEVAYVMPSNRTLTGSVTDSGRLAIVPSKQAVTSQPRAHIVAGSDTLQTGSDAAAVSPVLGGDRKWSLPNNAKIRILAKQGHDLLVRIGNDSGWIADTNVHLDTLPITNRSTSSGTHVGVFHTEMATPNVHVEAGYLDLRMDVKFAPFLIADQANLLRITIYSALHRPEAFDFASTAARIKLISDKAVAGGVEYSVWLRTLPWGYKAFYESDGTLVVRIRKQPMIDTSNVFSGLRIAVDPGHPPAGAFGPSGLTEAEANLALALRIQKLLEARGAHVIMTHTTLKGRKSSTNATIELHARTQMAVDSNADILLSVHNNAFPDGTNPFTNYGSTTYYYHNFSADLAATLIQAIDSVTQIPNKGARTKSLALCRPTWMPSVLTESLYLMFPEQEAALRDSNFLDRLAQAHIRGLEKFLIGRVRD
jgi:N-acetylmuramoyl-L-alanine amidase